MFNLEKYLQDKHIDYRTHGKNVSRGWININCPFCRGGDPSFHLGIKEATNWYSCWKCNSKGFITKLIRELENCSYEQAQQTAKNYGFIGNNFNPFETKIEKKEFEFPKQFEHQEIPHSWVVRYLYQRGFDPLYIHEKYNLYFPNPYNIGDYKFRLIIPVYYKHEMVSYLGRDITNNNPIRYLTCKNNSIKDYIYNYDNCSVGANLVIVEGVFDLWRIEGNSIALFGTKFTKQQLKLIYDLQPNKIFIMFDYDATKEAEKLSNELSFLFPVEILQLEKGDPGEMTEQEIKELKQIVGE